MPLKFVDMEAQSAFTNDGRHSDDDSKKADNPSSNSNSNSKDNKRSSAFDQQHVSHSRHHGGHSDSKHHAREHRDEKSKSDKRDRQNSSEKRSRTDERAQSTKSSTSSTDQRRAHHKQTSNSSDDSDSDSKKRSIFEVPVDSSPYVSMYDKVKARSCKNMQKQEEEKKIKAKFNKLKESRAKREGKKQSNSYDEDSDSDADGSEQQHRVKHTRNKGFLDSSTEDSDGRHSMQKHEMVSDSESNSRKGHFHMNRINDLCDGESSENSSSQQFRIKPRRRISSRKNSRSARITSETSDDASESTTIKQEPSDSNKATGNNVKCEVIKTEVVNIPKDDKQEIVQFKIKSEPNDFAFGDSNQTPDRSSNLCELSDGDSMMASSKASESKESIFDNLFSAEAKKRHKKNKKHQKSPSNVSNEDVSTAVAAKPVAIKHEEIKVEKSMPTMETMFDELKRDSSANDKKRHGKKDKKRDKTTKEQHDKSKEEKYRMKRMKKQSRLSSDGSVFEGQETFSQTKRGETMEDIFGPISDSDSQISSVDTHKSLKSNTLHSVGKASSTQQITVAAATIATPTPTPMTHNQNENNAESKSTSSGNLHQDKEKHREKRRDKKRKDRVKQQHQQSITSKDDENSVDLDAAARALEAQLMADSEQQKPEESSSDFGFSNAKEMSSKAQSLERTSASPEKPYDDVFRFSETEEGPENIFLRKEDTHRSKDKKKKKKKSRESRHHHHHSSHSSSFISPPTTPGLTIDTDAMDDLPPSKPSPTVSQAPETKSIDRPVIDPPVKPVETQAEPSKSEPPATTTNKQQHSGEDKRKDTKTLIPGFGLEIDSSIHNTAVQSISSDLVEKPEPEKVDEKNVIKEMADSTSVDKIEEKSRVIISQEETEDAVAALLGESFGMTTTDYFAEEPIVEDTANLPTSDDMIAEEEDEEMRKAVQSLNAEELDMKPDTPQSDIGLQIDTDTEEPDDSNELQIDESVRTDDNKQASPTKDAKKSPQKDIGMANNKSSSADCKKEIAKSTDAVDASNKSEIAPKTSVAASNESQNTATTTAAQPTIIAKAKPQVAPTILPPIIPKMASIDTPTDLLSVSIPTPTMVKPNVASEQKSTTKPTTTSK